MTEPQKRLVSLERTQYNYLSSTFCATRVFKPQILQIMYEFISAFATQKFRSF